MLSIGGVWGAYPRCMWSSVFDLWSSLHQVALDEAISEQQRSSIVCGLSTRPPQLDIAVVVNPIRAAVPAAGLRDVVALGRAACSRRQPHCSSFRFQESLHDDDGGLGVLTDYVVSFRFVSFLNGVWSKLTDYCVCV